MKYDLSGESLPDISGETEWGNVLREFSAEENDEDLVSFFRAKDTYVSRTTAAERIRWNNLYQLNIEGFPKTGYNVNFATIDAVPRPIYVNCVELPPPEHLNDGNMLNASNTQVTIIWKAYYFDEVTQGDIENGMRNLH